MLEFRKLRADEIECRISTINEKGCTLLLYKDARVDQNVLDEVVGPLDWQRDHKLIGDRLYCTVSIWDDGKQTWISKTDVGTESYTEKEKGQASDSFKRACFNWGLGRELYTAPFIWISANDFTVTQRNGKAATNDSFKVSKIEYDGNRISGLEIVKAGKFGKPDKVVFQWGGVMYDSELATPAERKKLYDLCQQLYVDYEPLLAKVGCNDKKKLTREQYAAALNRLKGTSGN